MYNHNVRQYQSQKHHGSLRTISRQRLHQLGADQKYLFSDNSQTFTTLIWWHKLYLGVFLVMYNPLSLNWHVSVSQNSYTIKHGLCCSHARFHVFYVNTNYEILLPLSCVGIREICWFVNSLWFNHS